GVCCPRPDLVDVLYGCAENFCNAPRLRDAADWTMRRVSLEDFRNVPQAGVGQVLLQRRQPKFSLPAGGFAPAVNLYICGDERTHQPRPDGALMVCAVAAGAIASVTAAVMRVARSKTAEAVRS